MTVSRSPTNARITTLRFTSTQGTIISPNYNIAKINFDKILTFREILNGTELPVDDPDVLNRLIPNPSLNVKFLIHGFGASKNDKFNQEIRAGRYELYL